MRRFTRRNFCMLILGIVTYVFDIVTDIWTAYIHLSEKHYIWCALTAGFVLLSGVTIQIFSYSWFLDDEDPGGTEGAPCSDCSKVLCKVAVVHCCQCGIFMRYWFAIQYGYQAAIKHCAVVKNSGSDEDDVHKSAVTQATDLCMLRLFETYLESAPQIILQSYILLHSEKRTLIQYAAIVTSFCSISWSTMDYHQSLRKSLPDKKRILWGFPACSYLLYKLFTISSWILSLTLLADVVLCATPILMAILWILGTIWACLQYTSFCTSKLLEYFYRMAVGIILTFTFFNVKGQKTKKHISIYYLFRVLGTTTILCLYWYTKPLSSDNAYFPAVSITVVLTLGLGIICLILYYGFLHPNVTDREQPFDMVDGLLDKKKSRREHFLQY